MVLRGAVHAGRHGAAGPAGRDAPEREGAEGVGRKGYSLCLGAEHLSKKLKTGLGSFSKSPMSKKGISSLA